mmetsp:Transcript_16954/g.23330  ORF Transcript_16954/g.23330 Transcript_16954/m.23330 type:complete len:1147 (+) Transcript_16954:5060-8500(+)
MVLFHIPLGKVTQYFVVYFLDITKELTATATPATRKSVYKIDNLEINLQDMDELSLVQCKRNTIIRAAAFTKMRGKIDCFSPLAELNFMVSHREHYVKEANVHPNEGPSNAYFEFYGINGMPYSTASFVDVAAKTSKLAALYRLKVSRSSALSLKKEITAIGTEYDQDVFLMKHFLAGFLSGYKSLIASTVMFGEETGRSHLRINSYNMFFRYASIILLPLYLLAVSAFVIYVGLQVHDHTAFIWLISGVVALMEDILWIQPVQIYVKYVAIPLLAKNDFLALFYVLSSRAKSILSREDFKIMHNCHALIQHFHPACRVARMFPNLSAARILISLTDYDLPISHLLAGKHPQLHRWHSSGYLSIFSNALGSIYWLFNFFCRGVLVAYLSIPIFAQLSVLELCAAAFINGVVVALYCCTFVGVGLVVGATVVFAALLLAFLHYLFPDGFRVLTSSSYRKRFFAFSSEKKNNWDTADSLDTNGEMYVESSLVYTANRDAASIYVESPTNELANFSMRFKPESMGMFRADSTDEMNVTIKIKPEKNSPRSDGSTSSGGSHPGRVGVSEKSHYRVTTDNGCDEYAIGETAFFDEPVAYAYSRTSRKEGMSPAKPHSEKVTIAPPASKLQIKSREVVTVEKARRIRAIIRQSSKKKYEVPDPQDHHMHIETDNHSEDNEAKHEMVFPDTKFDDSVSVKSMNSGRSSKVGSVRSPFNSPQMRMLSPTVTNAEDEPSPMVTDFSKKRSSAIRRRLSHHRKKHSGDLPSVRASPESFDSTTPIEFPPSPEQLAARVAAIGESSDNPLINMESVVATPIVKPKFSSPPMPVRVSPPAITTSVSFEMDKHSSSDSMPPSAAASKSRDRSASPHLSPPNHPGPKDLSTLLVAGPRLSNIHSHAQLPPASDESTVEMGEILHFSPSENLELSRPNKVINPKFTKPAAVTSFSGPRVGNINSVSRPIRNKREENDLRVVNVQTSGKERHPSPLDGVLRDSIHTNNSQVSALLSATMSPDSVDGDSAFSPHVGDIRSPNIKLAPLDHSMPIRKPHRRKISTLHERSKQLVSQSQPGAAVLSPDPLDASARRNIIIKSLSSKHPMVVEEKSDSPPVNKSTNGVGQKASFTGPPLRLIDSHSAQAKHDTKTLIEDDEKNDEK